jgi:hypothetical protein
MKSPQGQFIDNTTEDKLIKLGFEKRTNLGHPHQDLSCMWRSTKSGNIHLLPLFEGNGDNHLYAGGRLKIESVDQLKKLVSALKH